MSETISVKNHQIKYVETIKEILDVHTGGQRGKGLTGL